MERLSRRDLESLQSHLREIYVSSDLERFASRVVSTLPRILPSETVSYQEIDLQSRKIGAQVVDPLASDYASEDRVFRRHMHEHPLLNHYRQTGEGQAFKISDFLTKSQWRKRALYSEFFKEIRGIEHQMGIVIPMSTLMVGIALGRSGRDFSERDRSLLDLLRSHLVQAHRNATALTQTQHDVNHLRQAVEKLDRGIIAFAGKGRVLWHTELARRWVSEYFEPSWRADHLPEDVRRWTEHRLSLLSRDGDAPAPLDSLVIERAGKRLVVRMGPEGSEDRYLLLLEERTTLFAAEHLVHLGLTRREEEILLLVARGKTNKEIAATLYVSPLTVRKHLENIYHKLGVKNRAEATARALEVAATGR